MVVSVNPEPKRNTLSNFKPKTKTKTKGIDFTEMIDIPISIMDTEELTQNHTTQTLLKKLKETQQLK